MPELTADRLADLRRTESWFRLVADTVDTVIYLARADFSELLYVNPAGEALFGDAMGGDAERPASFADAVHPSDRDAYERDVAELVADVAADEAREAYEGEYRLCVDGETRWVRAVRYPVAAEGGDDYVVGTVEDVTEQRELERTYRDVFEHVSDGLVVHHPETGEVVDVNRRYCELTGYSKAELVGSDVGLVMTDDPDSEYSEAAARERIEAARTEGPQLFEWRGVRKDGDPFEAEISLTVVEIEGAERVLASVRDVTERKRREREYEQIFDGVTDIISVHDPETGEILEVNETYVRESGYDEATIREIGIEGLSADVEGYSAERARRIVREVAETGDPETVEWPVETAAGERRWYEVNATPARIGGERRVLGISRDVTERKRHERLVERLHESTERIQEAETATEVCEATVTAMEEVLDLSLPAVWLRRGGDDPDDDDPVLEPVAASEAARSFAGGPGPLGPGTFEWELYERGESAVYDPSERWDRTHLEHALMVPVGDHGVIGAADPAVDAFDDVVLDAARILARHTTTALDRVERAAERRESERRMRAVLDRIDEAIFLSDGTRLLDDEAGSVYVSAGYADVFGVSYDDLAADDSTAFVDLVHPDDRAAYQSELRERVRAVEERRHEDSYASEYRVRRPDGAVRWVHSDFYPIEWADDDYRFVIVSRDVTERKEREATLETFHEATRALTEAGSRKEASQRAVDAAADVLGLSRVSIHLYDESAGALRPVAETAPLREALDFLPTFEPGESLPWEVFVEGEAAGCAAVEAGAGLYGPGVPDPDVVLPLGPHGVMLVGGADGELAGETDELARILAATLEAALNHVRGQHELEEREAKLREHRQRAERLERLNTVIREIEQATVEESSRDAIERVVCDQLTSVDSYRAAWIAEPNRANEALVARTKAGGDEGYVDALAVDLTAEGVDRHPAAAALAEAETRTVRNLATSAARGDWRSQVLRAGYQSVAAVPLAHDETVHGVLCIVSDDPTAFDDRAEAILTELGRSVGYAVSVLERRRALESDTTTELEFAGADEGLLFVGLARAVGAPASVELERAIRRPDGSVGRFYTVSGADPERVREGATGLGRVDEATLVSADEAAETCLVEVETASWFGRHVVDHGGVVRTAEATVEGEGAAAEARLVVEAPRAADVRTLVDRLREEFPRADLVAQRTRERSVQTLLELRDVLDDRLTPRQRETLETAYSAGYFEWPRESSGQEIAELLDITQPTFNKHLRTAERKTFSMLLNRERRE